MVNYVNKYYRLNNMCPLMVGEFSNKAPILRNAAQQDEPGDEY